MASVMFGYTRRAGACVHVLKQCGDNLTRENVMKQAASIKDLELGGPAAGHQGQHRRRPTSLRSRQCS